MEETAHSITCNGVVLPLQTLVPASLSILANCQFIRKSNLFALSLTLFIVSSLLSLPRGTLYFDDVDLPCLNPIDNDAHLSFKRFALLPSFSLQSFSLFSF